MPAVGDTECIYRRSGFLNFISVMYVGLHVCIFVNTSLYIYIYIYTQTGDSSCSSSAQHMNYMYYNGGCKASWVVMKRWKLKRKRRDKKKG